MSASTAGAQAVRWAEVAGEGCASSISVAPNNVPIITGCGATPDHGISYLGTGTCSPSPCFPPPAWIPIAGGLQAARVFETINGLPFALTSDGRIYFPIHWNSNDDSYGGIQGWSEATPVNPTCISWLAPGQDSDAVEINLTPPAPPSDILESIWGVGCGTPDASIYQWNVGLGQILYDQAPGWLQLDPQDNAAGTQIVLFTGSGPTNPQVLWARNSRGAVYAYNGQKFVEQTQPTRLYKGHRLWANVESLTDHYAITQAGEVVSWNDNTNSWTTVIGTETPIGTYITQIAAAGAIQTVGYGTFGPSSVWGIDNVGNVFQLQGTGISQ